MFAIAIAGAEEGEEGIGFEMLSFTRRFFSSPFVVRGGGKYGKTKKTQMDVYFTRPIQRAQSVFFTGRLWTGQMGRSVLRCVSDAWPSFSLSRGLPSDFSFKKKTFLLTLVESTLHYFHWNAGSAFALYGFSSKRAIETSRVLRAEY